MQKIALSVINPNSYLICTGLKDVENRTWNTDYRGRVYIHSSGGYDYPCVGDEYFPKALTQALEKYDEKYPETITLAELQKAIKAVSGEEYYCLKYVEWFMKSQAALIEHYGVDIYDDNLDGLNKIVRAKGFYYRNFAIIGHVDLADVVKDSASPFAEKNCYHWILKNPVLYDKPVENVKGKLRLFDVSNIDLP